MYIEQKLNNKYAVSVIVPIYNVERQIERCVHSLFSQTLQDVEFIFVNDCTPDNSIEILKRLILTYPSVKNRVKIINNEKNCKLYVTRRVGMNAAEGEYITHVDSDDWLELDCLEKLYQKAKSTSADIVFCDFFNSSEEKEERESQELPDDKVVVVKEMLNCRFRWNIWAKLFRRTLYDFDDCEMNFDCTNYGEDMITIKLFYRAQKVVYLNNCLYHYAVATSDSITKHHLTPILVLQMLNSVKNIEDFFLQKDDYNVYAQSLIRLKLSIRGRFLLGSKNFTAIKLLCLEFQEINSEITPANQEDEILRLINRMAAANLAKCIYIFNGGYSLLRKIKHLNN
ncbi:MAG: glycosyltransferase family 2 protein [Bacteroidales bacterium]|jgi:glycosyltransferase involved in cell wall biosynthesis|nr:glycosyltransferase family 2 protein [Bacteroidales bacterium]